MSERNVQAAIAATRAELASLIARHTPADGVHATAVPQLMLVRCSHVTAPMPVVYQPMACILAQGRKQVVCGEETREYGPETCFVASVDLPVTGRVVEASPQRPLLHAAILLDMGELCDLLLAADIADAGGEEPGLGLSLCPAELPLLGAVTRLVALLDTPRDIPVLAPLLLREVCYRLLTGPQCAHFRQMVRGNRRNQAIYKAIRQIKERYAEPLQINRLAQDCAMGVSTFHRHFKAVTAISPLQYQKLVRLQEARHLMLGTGMDAAAACHRVGYESPSQFSRDYSRVFGAPPLRDIQRLRQQLAGSGAPPETAGWFSECEPCEGEEESAA